MFPLSGNFKSISFCNVFFTLISNLARLCLMTKTFPLKTPWVHITPSTGPASITGPDDWWAGPHQPKQVTRQLVQSTAGASQGSWREKTSRWVPHPVEGRPGARDVKGLLRLIKEQAQLCPLFREAGNQGEVGSPSPLSSTVQTPNELTGRNWSPRKQFLSRYQPLGLVILVEKLVCAIRRKTSIRVLSQGHQA